MSSYSDKQFLLAYVTESFNEQLDDDKRQKFDQLLENEEHKAAVDQFQKSLGNLQLGLQALYMDDSTSDRIRSFVLDSDVAESEAAEVMDRISVWEHFLTLKNRLIIIAVACFAIYFLVSFLTERGPQKFENILQTIHYESLALENHPEGRLNLPTSDYGDIEQYLSEYTGLDFKPDFFKSAPNGWQVQGAAVYDYSGKSLAVVQFSKSETESLFHFSLNASLSDLPKSERGMLAGSQDFEYYAYSSDDFNIVVWPSGSTRLSFLVGRLGGEELAEIARDYSQIQ